MAPTSESNERISLIADAIAAVVLSVAALLTSWASFQASLWDGEQAANYTRAQAERINAGLLTTEDGQMRAIDLFLFTQWLNAYAAKDQALQQFYHQRFRGEFRVAFDAWLARRPIQDPKAPHTPLAMPEYAPALERQAAALNKRADALFDEGQHCNQISDSYVAATVVLALALFMGGIGQTFDRERLTLGLTSLAAVACVFGLIQLLALPAQTLN